MTDIDTNVLADFFDRIEAVLASDASNKGKLVLASFGQVPATKKNLKAEIRQFDTTDYTPIYLAARFLGAQDHRNVYMSLAIFREDLQGGKKGREDDIESVFGFVCDFDAKDDPDAHKWLERVPEGWTFVLETSSKPQPSFQVFYLLDAPIAPDEAKEIAILLTEKTGSDHGTKDTSHVWRIPGLLNRPNAKKVAQGRPEEPQLVTICAEGETPSISADSLKAYLLSMTDYSGEKKISAKTDKPLKTSFETVDVDLDSLPISKRMKKLIVEGGVDGKYASRSEAVFAVVNALSTEDENVTFSILTNPDYLISTSVLEKSKPADYIAGEIKRASEKSQAVGDIIEQMNKKHAVCKFAGKTVIVNFQYDHVLQRDHMTFSSFQDFRNYYSNQKILVDFKSDQPVYKSKALVWLDSNDRRQYESVVFDPQNDFPNTLNLWRGFAIDAKEGDWSLMKRHIQNVICSGNKELAQYIARWMARAVQHPSKLGEVMICLKGKKGTGKGTLCNEFAKIFGQHSLAISNAKHLTGNFNAHLQDCVFLFVDEGFWAGDKAGEGVLKSLITEPNIPIERKGKDVQNAKNCLHIMMASNSDWLVPASADERRYCVVEVSEGRMQDKAYFTALHKQMDNGGREAMLYDLLKADLSEFEVRDVPQTHALMEQKYLSLDLIHKWWADCLLEKAIPIYDTNGFDTLQEWPTEVVTADLLGAFKNSSYAKGHNAHYSNAQNFGRKIKEIMPDSFERKQKSDGSRFYSVSPHDECVEAFESKTGVPLKIIDNM